MAAQASVVARLSLPRLVHPFAWWGYALALAVAASATSNPILLAGLVAVVCLVTLARRGTGPWASAFKLYLILGAFIVVMRVAFRVLFGGGDGPTILFTLPEIPLPDFVVGIRLLGPVSLESLLTGLYDGARLATMIICIGAANSLANPKKLLSSLPGALYELGTVLIVAISALPQLGESIQRVLRARKLRAAPKADGKRRRQLRFVETILVPVLSDALERSLALAASMDARGYGRSGHATQTQRRLSWLLAVGSVLTLALWAFRFLVGAADARLLGIPLISTLLLCCGLGLAAAAMRMYGATARRTQYRPIRWRLAETLTLASGLGTAAIVLAIGSAGEAAVLFPPVNPFVWPTLTPALLAALAIACLPAFLTPPPELREAST